jgi:GAF domain-containing protein
MKKNDMTAKFKIVSIVLALIPIIAVSYIVGTSSYALTRNQVILLIVALVLFLSCVFILLYLFKKLDVSVHAQLEKYAQERQRCMNHLQVISEMTELAKNAANPDELLKITLDKAMQVVEVRNGSVFLVDPTEPEGLRFVAAKPEVAMKKDDNKPGRYSFVRSVIESGKPLLIQNIENDPRTMKSNDPKYGSPSFISMPVYKDNHVIAVFNMANKEKGGAFTDSDERILSLMLGEIGFVLDNISLRKRIKELLFKTQK